MNQNKFTVTILSRFDMLQSKPASTPLSPSMRLYKSTQEELDKAANEKRPYRNAVGYLMYLAQCTRPDLAHAVGVLSQHLENPSRQHWDAVTHILQYLRGTTDMGIVYDGNQTSKTAGHESFALPLSHCDADWAGDCTTRRSTTGYVFMLAGGPSHGKVDYNPQ